MLPPDHKGRVMTVSLTIQTLPLLSIERPWCLRCCVRMSFDSVTAGLAGYELRKLECAKCKCAEIVTIETDPMDPTGMKWVAGELQTPL